MEIGEPRRVREVEPVTTPVPETIPVPSEEPVRIPDEEAPHEPVAPARSRATVSDPVVMMSNVTDANALP